MSPGLTSATRNPGGRLPGYMSAQNNEQSCRMGGHSLVTSSRILDQMGPEARDPWALSKGNDTLPETRIGRFLPHITDRTLPDS